VLGKLQDVDGHSGGEKRNLDLTGEVLEDVLDLLLEATGEHLISLIEYEDLQVVRLEEAFLHHVVNTPRGTNNNMDALLKDLDFIADYGSTNASVDLDSYELANLLDNESDLLSELSGGGDH